MSDSTDFYEIDAIGFSDSTTPTGRINESKPRIVYIDAPGSKAAVAATLVGHRFSSTMIDADYSEIEERILAQMVSTGPETPEELLMQEMENVYKYQVQSTEQLDKFMRDPYGVQESRERGQGRKNGHRSSRHAKDHRSATKRQRSARKKNRKK